MNLVRLLLRAMRQSRRPPVRVRRGRPPQSTVGNTVLTGRAWVIDGDTIVIKGTHIRLFGIDAPEIDHPYGNVSKGAMIKLCQGHIVTAHITGDSTYDRIVARCELPDGRDLSAELVKLGLAIDWPKYSGGCYRHLEPSGVRRKLWRAAARQRGKMPTS